MIVDVAVIGAGPAGSTLARLLAARGLDVALFEKEHLPRYKPCGGGLTAKALPWLPAEATAVARDRASAAELCYRHRGTIATARGTAVLLVRREELDQALCASARAAGARLFTGCAARLERSDRHGCIVVAGDRCVHARYVALAHGALGQASPRPRWAAALEAEVRVGKAAAEAYRGRLVGDFGAIPGGYAWIFPKGDTLSIGVATWNRKAARGLRQALARFLAERELNDLPLTQLQGHPIPVGGTLGAEALAVGRVLRVGDAAGLCDPLFGEGIAYALESAHLAAAALASDRPEGYRAEVERRLLPRFRLLGLASRCFYQAPGVWMRGARLAPALANELLARVTGVRHP